MCPSRNRRGVQEARDPARAIRAGVRSAPSDAHPALTRYPGNARTLIRSAGHFWGRAAALPGDDRRGDDRLDTRAMMGPIVWMGEIACAIMRCRFLIATRGAVGRRWPCGLGGLAT